MMEFCVDFQSFVISRNTWMVKELAIIPLISCSDIPSLYLFKPLYSRDKLFTQEKKNNSFVEKQLHKISWEAGTIPPGNLVKIMQNNLKNCKAVYVKGLQKKVFIQNLLPDM